MHIFLSKENFGKCGHFLKLGHFFGFKNIFVLQTELRLIFRVNVEINEFM